MRCCINRGTPLRRKKPLYCFNFLTQRLWVSDLLRVRREAKHIAQNGR